MDPLITALILSKALEFGVSEHLINRGMIEGNPLGQDRQSRIILNSAFIAGSPFIYKEIKKKNKKAAKIVAIVLIASNGYLIHHNLKLMRNAR